MAEITIRHRKQICKHKLENPKLYQEKKTAEKGNGDDEYDAHDDCLFHRRRGKLSISTVHGGANGYSGKRAVTGSRYRVMRAGIYRTTCTEETAARIHPMHGGREQNTEQHAGEKQDGSWIQTCQNHHQQNNVTTMSQCL